MGSGLVETLMARGYLKSPAIIAAFQEIPRSDFAAEAFRVEAESDMSLPITHGQTLSRPQAVAQMLELLDPRPGQCILDVGSGSGFTSALLGHIVGTAGKVVALERLPELYTVGKKNIEKFSLIHAGIVECVLGDGALGYEAFAPYDRILVSAAVESVPPALKKQLKVGGIIVLPLGRQIGRLEKSADGTFLEETFPGSAFEPLIEK